MSICEIFNAFTVSDYHFHFSFPIWESEALRLLFCKKPFNVSWYKLTFFVGFIDNLAIMKRMLLQIMRILLNLFGLSVLVMVSFRTGPFYCHTFLPFNRMQDVNIMAFNLRLIFTDDYLSLEDFQNWHFFINGWSCLYRNFLRNPRLFSWLFMKCLFIDIAEVRTDYLGFLFNNLIAGFYSLFGHSNR